MTKTARTVEDSNYLETRHSSYETLVEKGLVNEEFVAVFQELETAMNRGGLLGEDFLDSYHNSDDTYKRYLEKIINALIDVGEPYAEDKLKVVIEELATMGPAVFLTPWELTLKYLDSHYGNFKDVEDFYDEKHKEL